MMQKLTSVLLLLVATGCGDISGGRAPKHSSQSRPQITAAATTQSGAQAESQRDAEATMRRELDQTSARHAVRKIPAPGSPDLFALLKPGADHQFRVALHGGVAYSIVGACDSGCGDVDIELLQASDGLVVKRDLLRDNYPVIEFTPPGARDYYVRIILKACVHAQCHVGARILRTA
jgi:hypothetical protein